MKRLFMLQGEPFDLQDLAELFSTGPRTVTRHDEHYYLSVEMQDNLEDEQAIALAEDELTTINGLALVTVDDYRRVRITGVSALDPTTGKLIPPLRVKVSDGIRARDSFSGAINGNPQEPQVTQGSPGETILALAANNNELKDALFLYGTVDHNWRGLYMVLDAIQKGAGGRRKFYAKPWANKAKKKAIEAFKGTSNSYDAFGADARHGPIEKQVVKKPTIGLSEARQLIRNLLNGWITELRSQ